MDPSSAPSLGDGLHSDEGVEFAHWIGTTAKQLFNDLTGHVRDLTTEETPVRMPAVLSPESRARIAANREAALAKRAARHALADVPGTAAHSFDNPEAEPWELEFEERNETGPTEPLDATDVEPSSAGPVAAEPSSAGPTSTEAR